MKVTHPDKIYWEKGKISKANLVEYYQKMAKVILPYLKGRALVMHRFPNGVEKGGFFQKEAGDHLPFFVKTAKVQHKGKKITYITVENKKILEYVVNLGSIELHPFNSQIKTIEKPDYLVFDLDPVEISFAKVVEVAQLLHKFLEKLNIPSFCKTTGGRGLHIFVPLKKKYDYLTARKFAEKVANAFQKENPKLTSRQRLPKNRKKKVYIDCLQNVQGHTLICPYSVKATDTPTVSTPLLWSEVKKGLDPKKFTIDTVLKRMSQREDPFKKVLSRGANLTRALKRVSSN